MLNIIKIQIVKILICYLIYFFGFVTPIILYIIYYIYTGYSNKKFTLVDLQKTKYISKLLFKYNFNDLFIMSIYNMKSNYLKLAQAGGPGLGKSCDFEKIAL